MAQNQDNSSADPDKYSEMYSRYSDPDIISILKKRDLYQPEAVKAAITEAVNRGIIHSEQDLFSQEFKTSPLLFSLFPVPEKKEPMEKLRRSLTRIILLSGLIPVIHGIINIKRSHNSEVLLHIFAGLVWMVLTGLYFKSGKSIFLILQFVLLIISLAYTGYHFMSMKQVPFMDILVSIFVFTLLAYFLSYLKKIRNQNN